MYATRIVQVLVAVVSILCVVQATWWDAQKVHHRGLLRRADILPDGLGSDVTNPPSSDKSTPTSTPPPAQTSSTPTPDSSSDAPSSTSASPSSTPSSDAPSSTPSADSSSSSSSSTPASTSADPTSSSPPDSSSTSGASAPGTTPPPTSTKPSGSESDKDTGGKTSAGGDDNSAAGPNTTPAPIVSTKIEVIVKTNTDGSKVTETSTTRTTETAGLNADSTKPTGMTVKTRNTIIGVVVGVGGAAILGALGLVAFRIWGRKRQNEEADGLMAYNADLTAAAEKSPRGSSSGGARNPFQSTLENYHQPVNASANF